MKMKLDKGTKLQAFMAKQLATTPLSQKEIAEAVGYNNQNMITMIKQGDAKLALDRVPAMAKILQVDPKHLFRLALEQSYPPAAVATLMTMLDASITTNEMKVVEIFREKTGNTDPEITPELQARIEDALSG